VELAPHAIAKVPRRVRSPQEAQRLGAKGGTRDAVRDHIGPSACHPAPLDRHPSCAKPRLHRDPPSSSSLAPSEACAIIAIAVESTFNQRAAELIIEGRLAEAQVLLEAAIHKMPTDWTPIREDTESLRIFFWDQEEFLAYDQRSWGGHFRSRGRTAFSGEDQRHDTGSYYQ
jgi:hypothetical protein